MLTVLFLVVWIINLYYCFIGKENRIVNVITIIFTVMLFAGNTYNGDYYGYYYPYQSGDMSNFERGFATIGELCGRYGLSYQHFLAVICIPCYIVLLKVIRHFKANLSTFISLYYAILVFYDIGQFRNFIVAVFLSYGLILLAKEEKIKFVVLILAASYFFHTIALSYIPLVFLVRKKEFRKKSIIIAFLLSLMIGIDLKYFQGRHEIIRDVLLVLGPTSAKASWYADTQINLGFLYPVLYCLCNVILVYLSVKYLRKYDGRGKNESLINICYVITVYSLIVLPLCLVNLTFDRIFRNFNYIHYILAGITINNFRCYQQGHRNENYKVVRSHCFYIDQLYYFLYLIIYSIAWSLGTILRYNGFAQVEPILILNNNIFFQ